MKTLTTLACLATLAASGAAMAETPVPGIDGNWASITCEVRPQAGADGAIGTWWLTRKINFKDGRIEADFTTYAGPGCDFALQTLSFAGRVDVLGDSAVMAGAKEANLTIDEFVRITPQAQGFADFLNSAPPGSCGADAWEVGVTQDILETGCPMLGVQPNTPTIEYEVLAVDGDHVYFGARPVTGTFLTSPDDRPKALLVPAKRAD